MEGKTIDKKILASRLKELREKNNLKQRDMYEAMQCSQSAYSSYENPDSVKFPSAENLFNLSQRFNVSIDWLLGNEVSKKNNEDLTLADIIRCLFWIDERIDISIVQNEDEQIYKFTSEDDRPDSTDLCELFFPDCCERSFELNSFLKEWKETKEFCNGKSIGRTMYSLWKNDTLKKAREIDILGLLPFPAKGGFKDIP